MIQENLLKARVISNKENLKILPVAKTPVSTFPHTADLAAILWNNKKIYPWLMNCFIKVYGWHVEDMDYNMDYEDFYILDCPAILYERINYNVLKCGWNNPIDFVKEMINLKYYIYVILDTSKLLAHEGTCFHDVLIYGYDDNEKIFYAADCFKEGKYMFEKISYNEFDQSFRYGKKDFENVFEFHDDLILIRENPDFSFTFYPSRVRESLVDYINAIPGKYTFSRLKLECPEEYDRYVFGKNNYKIIYKHLEYGKKVGGVLPHYRQVFHLMFEMKDIMCERIKYMHNTGHINNFEYHFRNYSELRNKALICQNLILKYQITEDKNILNRIDENVRQIEMNEIKCINDMLDDII